MALFGLGCFWGAERKFWQVPGVIVTAVGYAGGLTPNPTYEEVCSGMTGHNEAVFVVYDPKQVSYEELLKLFFESHNPTQGMRRATTSARNIAPASITIQRRRRRPPRPPRRPMDARSQAQGLGADHHRDPAGARILFRRGLSPAISRQEPTRLLRARRHRRHLPDRHGRRSLGYSPSPAVIARLTAIVTLRSIHRRSVITGSRLRGHDAWAEPRVSCG